MSLRSVDFNLEALHADHKYSIVVYSIIQPKTPVLHHSSSE
ncbi:hypothetical protein D1AOALGA4SA_10334 [Olavius algarvensis Delta 1 endosymbiont]|nr:hypothetical protein D1AOALGA4SA_10334 [Olavius algarvensis Delta 1 endosymbiont]